MTTDDILVLAWLVLAHLVADFVLQTDGMVADKFTAGSRAWRGLLAHGAAVALCLSPAAVAYGLRGVALIAVVTAGHVAIDRWKVRATRHAEASALAGSHRRREEAVTEADSLGPAWTPVPGALFVVDQLLHLALIAAAWVVLVARVPPTPEWSSLIDALLPGDGADVHRWTLTAVVLASLAIVNVRAGALFVATLVRPRESVTGARPAPASPEPAPPAPVGWQVRVGGLTAIAEPLPPRPPAPSGGPAALSRTAPGAQPPAAHAPPARIGATIGVLERVLIVTFVLSGSTAAIGFVVAAKTLARFKQLDDRDFAEYYLLGTLASVAVALGSGLIAQAALAAP